VIEVAKNWAREYKPIENELSQPVPVDDWITQYFYIPELEGPIELYPYHKRVLREALSTNENGKFNYNLVLWSDVKKSSKSCIAAALALYYAYQTPRASIKIVANDLKQADSRVAMYVRRAIDLNPKMKVKQIQYLTTLPNQSTIEAIPIDPAGEAGANDDLIIFSEVWAAKSKSIQQMWTEQTLSPIKFGHSQRWVETYAGYSGESPILEKLYSDLVKDEYRIDSDLELYAHDGMLCLWNTQPRLPWLTNEYYESERQVHTPAEFNRIHRNQWSSSVEKFVERIWWDNCKGNLPPLTRDDTLVIALDANKGSHTSQPADTFSIVGVTRHPENTRKVAVRYCGVWNAPQNQLMDYTEPLNELKRLCSEFAVVEIAYDSFQLQWAVTQMIQEGIGHFKEFGQTSPRLKADKGLRDMIISGDIIHDGNPILQQHIENANIQNRGEDGVRLVKRNNRLKIDAAVALSMAVDRCMYYNLD
jgi:phage terminase large subunit-like protein